MTREIAVSLVVGSIDGIFKIFSYYSFDLIWNKLTCRDCHPAVVWLTGLSGAGKTTIAEELHRKLKKKKIKCIILDGDEIRNIFPSTGFDKESRIKHNINVGYMAALLEKQGYIVIVSLISPYVDARIKCREMANNFIETYISTSIEVCEKRDVKGLYKKARAGQIKDFTGIDSAYESPVTPELTIDTAVVSIEKSAEVIMKRICKRKKTS